MCEITLDLIDGEGDTLYVTALASGHVKWGWTREGMRNDVSLPFRQSEWEESKLRRPCAPFVAAALAALKEQSDA